VLSSAIGRVLQSMSGSGLENILSSVLGGVLGVYLEATSENTSERISSILGVCHCEQLGVYSQAGWECAIKCNQKCTSKCTWDHPSKCIWQLALMCVVCSMMYTMYNVMYSMQHTKADAYQCNQVNM